MGKIATYTQISPYFDILMGKGATNMQIYTVPGKMSQATSHRIQKSFPSTHFAYVRQQLLYGSG